MLHPCARKSIKFFVGISIQREIKTKTVKMRYMENKLEYLEEFKKTLAHYNVSEDSKQILANTKLVLLLAPSGGGRNTVIRELTKTDQYHFIISDTTRKPRINDGVAEVNGVEYWFRSEEEILADLKAGKFLEAELIHDQQVSGISIRELEKAHQEHRIAITDVDMGGLHNIVLAKPDAKAILVLPPSFDEWQRRMLSRGAMNPNEHNRRLQTAVRIFNMALKHEYFDFIVNDTLQHAVAQIESTTANTESVSRSEARHLAETLRDETKDYLSRT